MAESLIRTFTLEVLPRPSRLPIRRVVSLQVTDLNSVPLLMVMGLPDA